MESKLKTIQLDDGSSILIEVIPDNGNGDYLEEVSTGDEVFNSEELLKGITNISSILKESIDKVKPSEATVEFSLGAEVKEGKLLALLCGGTLKGNIKVTLKWS